MGLIKKSSPQYDRDFYRWTKAQAALLKQKKFEALDIENLVDEIQSLGKSDKRIIKSDLITLLLHLLKTEYQPSKATHSWNDSIHNAKREIDLILDDSPSLKRELTKMVEFAYGKARNGAALKTGLPLKKFPLECPWDIHYILK